MIAQTLEITRFNLLGLQSRLYSSLVIVVGIGAVVSVLVSILAMGNGFRASLVDAARPDRALVLRAGSDGEMNSSVSIEQAAIISQMEGVFEASTELFAVADVPKRDNDAAANLPLRGVSAEAFSIRPEVKIIAGRAFEWGTSEVIAGVKASAEFQGVDLGSELPMRDMELSIVGLFESDGGIYETEIWGDVRTLQGAMRRPDFTSLRVRFDPSMIDALNQRLEDDKRLQHSFLPETEFYAQQSESTSGIIIVFGYIVAGIMAVGAIFGALNTMYSAVSVRAREIATLRALGFAALPVVVSVMIEALALAVAGGIVGAGSAYLLFNGYTASTLNQSSFSQVAFDFAVTPELMTLGVTWALALGFVGGLLPALQAARMPIVQVLRGE